jgi:hypothetical protein
MKDDAAMVAPETDTEPAYYQAIEEFFVSRRGDPLFLSNADWLLIREWRSAGIPLRVALRGIADALDSHAHSWSRDRKVGSLRYCAAEVAAARERWERALGMGEDDTDLAAALAHLALALEQATGLGPRAAAVAREAAAGLHERLASLPQPRQLEAWLSQSESALLAEIRSQAGPAEVARVEADVARELEPFRARMPERVTKQIASDTVARRLLEAHGIPRLSLFHLA